MCFEYPGCKSRALAGKAESEESLSLKEELIVKGGALPKGSLASEGEPEPGQGGFADIGISFLQVRPSSKLFSRWEAVPRGQPPLVPTPQS